MELILRGETTSLDARAMASITSIKTFACKTVKACYGTEKSKVYKENFMETGFAVPTLLLCQRVRSVNFLVI